MSAEPFDPGPCDVEGCTGPAIWCDVGEAGDVWLCGNHTIAYDAIGSGSTPKEEA